MGRTLVTPDGAISRGAAVVGIWWRDRGLSVGMPTIVKVAWRTAANVARAIAFDVSDEDGPEAFEAVRAIVGTMGDLDDGGDRLRSHWFHLAVLHAATQSEIAGIVPRAEFDGDVLGHHDAFTWSCRAFLAGLDPRAVDLALSQVAHADILARWDGIDATFTPGAPLRAAYGMAPALAATLASAWSSDPLGFRADMARGDPWPIVSRRLAGSGLPRWLVAALPDAVRWWPTRIDAPAGAGDGEPEGFIARMAASSRNDPEVLTLLDPPGTRRGRYLRVPRDLILFDVSALASLPADRLPRGEQWAAFRRCDHVLASVAVCAGRKDVDEALGVRGGDWDGWSARLLPPSGDADDLKREMHDLQDHATAYARQVVIPALRLMGEDTGLQMAGDNAFAMLHSGRAVRSWLETSRRWHAARTTIDALVATLPGKDKADPPWKPCLPDHDGETLSIRVLTTAAALSSEGATGMSIDGMAGLAHCVGGYASWCRRGGSRILGILRRGPDGTSERLSTVEATFDGDGTWAVAQHRGARNGEPPADAVDFLGRYVEFVARNPGLVRREDLEPVPEPDDDACGYDHRHPGNWEAVRDAWAPIVPRAIRRMEPPDFVELDAVLTGMPRGRTWLPRPLTPRCANDGPTASVSP